VFLQQFVQAKSRENPNCRWKLLKICWMLVHLAIVMRSTILSFLFVNFHELCPEEMSMSSGFFHLSLEHGNWRAVWFSLSLTKLKKYWLHKDLIVNTVIFTLLLKRSYWSIINLEKYIVTFWDLKKSQQKLDRGNNSSQIWYRSRKKPPVFAVRLVPISR